MTAYPKNFIPLVDAFEVAVVHLARELRETDELLSSVADCEAASIYQESDEARRKVERLFRDALADGPLDACVEGPNGKMWKLDDREAWRAAALGVPGFEPKTHHLTNPGPNDDRSVFIKRKQLKEWLANLAGAPRHAGGAPPKYDWVAISEEAMRLMDYNGDFNAADPEWNSAGCLERALMAYCAKKFGREPASSTLRGRIPRWVEEWRSSKGARAARG